MSSIPRESDRNGMEREEWKAMAAESHKTFKNAVFIVALGIAAAISGCLANRCSPDAMQEMLENGSRQ